jgi:hypothetical protein
VDDVCLALVTSSVRMMTTAKDELEMELLGQGLSAPSTHDKSRAEGASSSGREQVVRDTVVSPGLGLPP